MRNQILASETFSRANKYYFLDFKVASNHSNYIQITRSDQQDDNTYKRSQVIIFEEDFHFLIQAFASLFQTASYQHEQSVSVREIYEQKQLERSKSIKDWSPELRPREKMLQKGSHNMRDNELIAMLIGSGSPDESAVGLADKILESAAYSLSRLAGFDHYMLLKFAGMGLAKSSSIIAALELGKRLSKQLAP